MNTRNLMIFIFILTSSINAHNEFYKVQNGQLVLTNSYPFVHWQNNQITLLLQFLPATIPFELDYNETINEFRNGYTEWSSVSCYNFGEAPFDGVPCNFSTNPSIFPDPEKDGGGTVLAIEEIFGVDYIVEYAFFPRTGVSQTQVAYNNTINRIFQWTNAIVFPPFTDWAHFRSTVVHEFGHMLGLNHCTQLEATMWPVIYFNTYNKATLSSYDITGVNILCGATGVEDYILVWVDNREIPFNVNQLYVGRVHSTFIDLPPYGDYIVEWGNWKIKALTNCSEILILEDEYGYINIPPLPNGHFWLRDANGYVLAKVIHSGIDNTGYYHEGYADIIISGVPDNSSGTLTSDSYWCGNITITGNITVPAGITLTIYPGSNIKFDNGASLIVYGKLDALGLSFSKITFDRSGTSGTWGSVTFDGNSIQYEDGPSVSNSILDNVIIKNGTGVRYINNANATIKNSSIVNCAYGIYIYNSQPKILNNIIYNAAQNAIYGEASGKSPLIKGNTITRTIGGGYIGIYLLNNTNPFITFNDISGFQQGVYLGGGVTSVFSDLSYSTPVMNNRFRNNSYGMMIGWGAYVVAGKNLYEESIWYLGQNNSIYNNLRDVHVYQSSTVWAQQNYWGGSGPNYYVDGSSHLYSTPYLTSDPWSGYRLADSKETMVEEGENPTGFDPDSILAGILLERNGRFQEAVNHYIRMIGRNSHSEFAITRLAVVRNRAQIPGIRQFIETLIVGNRPYRAAALNILASIYLNDDRYEDAIELYDIIINDYPESYSSENALFEKFFAALHYADDLNLASQLLSQLQSLNNSEEDFLMRLEIAESMLEELSPEGLFKKGFANASSKETNLPLEYSLLGNYPNPFNPSTTISYALPYQSSVALVIYDIMGRVVKSFNILSQESGYQNIVWDGRNENGSSVSSGVYLYRIEAKSLENSEAFMKTAKLMMLK